MGDFEEDHPGLEIDVRIKSESGDADLLNSLSITSMAAPGALPALIALPRHALETASQKGLIRPLDIAGELQKSEWFPYARELAEVDGMPYGLPFAGDALVIVYRPEPWDVLRFAYLPADSLVGGALRLALEQRGLRSVSSEAVGNPFVSLDRSWETYYATRTRSLKKANNLAANRLKKAGEVKIERLAPGAGSSEDRTRFLKTIIDISARSRKTRTGNSLDNPGPQAFIRRLSELAHEQGWLSLWLLYLDGVPLAMEYQLAADGDVFALRSDFDGSRDDISPGSYLSRVLLETLFTECKGRYYMGPGDNAYKFRWTEEIASISQLAVYSNSLTGRLLATWELSLKPLARRVRDRLKPARPAAEPASVEE